MSATEAPTGARRYVEIGFETRYGGPPELLVRAPARVNLIGGHTDYNDGFVLPVAIDRECWIALRSRTGREVRVHSLEFGDGAFALDGLSRDGEDWTEYLKGVAWALGGKGYGLSGWDAVLGSDIPIGAGLSSSAAIEMAVLRVFAAVSALPWDPREAARLGRLVENEWIGVDSGIMDQLAVTLGRRDHALLIDCRTLEVEPVPLPPEAAIVVLDTGTRRGLVDSGYNERRRQCEAAAAACGAAALRDVDEEQLGAAPGLDPVVRRRARHVVTENARTLQAADALRTGDLAGVGRLMDASHASLREDFEVSTDALDTMADLARGRPGCFGARMTGAGFGGCAIALVERSRGPAFAEEVTELYRAALDLTPQAYVCAGADGVSVVDAPPRTSRSTGAFTREPYPVHERS